jgi:hypothetical protein
MVSVALQAAANPAIHTGMSNAGAIGIIIIYGVGVAIIAGMLLYFENDRKKYERKKYERDQYK